MNNTLLLSQFDLLATAPGGVAKLRELILTLAVQGKLVPQNPEDEPASELLKRIRAEKDRLIAAGKIKRDKPLAPIGEEEQPFALPMGWEWVPVGSVGTTQTGGTPASNRPEYFDGNFPFIGPGQITPDGDVLPPEKHISIIGAVESTVAEIGDILMVCIGGSIGKCAAATYVTAFNQQINSIRPVLTLSNYVLLAMSASGFTDSVLRASTGSATPIISRGKWDLLPFPLPPLPEQARIVTRVEELMRVCDTLEAQGQQQTTHHRQLVQTLLGTLTDADRDPDSTTPTQDAWQRVAQHFDTLLDRPSAVDALEQTILQLAVRGQLVPQDPTDEPASDLLKRIRTEKDRLIAAGKIKRDKPLAPIGEDEQPFELPVGWELVRIDSVAEVQGGIQKTPLRRPVKNHHPYLRVANVQRDAFKLDEIERYELTDEELARWTLVENDLLIVEGNGSEDEIGRCAVWSGQISGCVYQNHLIRVRCLDAACVQFLKLFLNSPSGTDEMKRLAITTSGLYNLSVGKIRNFAFPLPPLPEQARIVARLAQLRHLCADLRHRLTQSHATQAALAEALVVHAISGVC